MPPAPHYSFTPDQRMFLNNPVVVLSPRCSTVFVPSEGGGWGTDQRGVTLCVVQNKAGLKVGSENSFIMAEQTWCDIMMFFSFPRAPLDLEPQDDADAERWRQDEIIWLNITDTDAHMSAERRLPAKITIKSSFISSKEAGSEVWRLTISQHAWGQTLQRSSRRAECASQTRPPWSSCSCTPPPVWGRCPRSCSLRKVQTSSLSDQSTTSEKK